MKYGYMKSFISKHGHQVDILHSHLIVSLADNN